MTILGVYSHGSFTAILSTMPLLAGRGGRSTLDPGTAWPCGGRCQMGSGLTRSKPIITGFMESDGDVYAPGTGAPTYALYITFNQANSTTLNATPTQWVATEAAVRQLPQNPTIPVDRGPGTAWALGTAGAGNPDGREGACPIHRYQPYPNATIPTERKANAILSRFSYIDGFAIQWGNGNSSYGGYKSGFGTSDEFKLYGKYNEAPEKKSWLKPGGSELEHVKPSSQLAVTVGANIPSNLDTIQGFFKVCKGAANYHNEYQNHVAFQLYLFDELYDISNICDNQKKKE